MTTATDEGGVAEPGDSFLEWLKDHQHGETLEEIEDALREVVTSVQTYGKSGKLSFTLDVGTKGRTITVVADVKTKVPGEPRTADIFFADNEGDLHRKDPYQPEIPANVVPIGDAETKAVEPDADAPRKVGESS